MGLVTINLACELGINRDSTADSNSRSLAAGHVSRQLGSYWSTCAPFKPAISAPLRMSVSSRFNAVSLHGWDSCSVCRLVFVTHWHRQSLFFS
jgi:hypothetical protein